MLCLFLISNYERLAAYKIFYTGVIIIIVVAFVVDIAINMFLWMNISQMHIKSSKLLTTIPVKDLTNKNHSCFNNKTTNNSNFNLYPSKALQYRERERLFNYHFEKQFIKLSRSVKMAKIIREKSLKKKAT